MPTQREIYLLAAEVGCVERTVKRWLRGGTVNGPTAYALERAAKELKIEVDLAKIAETEPPADTEQAPAVAEG